MAYFQAKHLWVDDAGSGIAAVVLDGPDRTIQLDPMILDELEEALTRIEAEEHFRICLVKSKKGASFCHGVSASTFADLTTPQAWEAFVTQGQRVCTRLSQLRVPTVAMIAGGCFGGGLELALACDWRVATDAPATQFGFNELEWGLLPSWGGIGRLLGLVGLERGLQFMLGSKKLSAFEALRWSLVDGLTSSPENEPAALLAQAGKRTTDFRPRRTWRQRLFESTRLGRGLILRGAKRVLKRRVPDDMPAPWELHEAIRIEAEEGAAAGLAQVRAAITRLSQTSACRNLLHLHLVHEQQRLAQAGSARLKRIGILGATPLALHLAAQVAVKGCRVVLREKDELTLGMATLQLVKALQEDSVRRSITPEQFKNHVNRIRPTVSWQDFDQLELIIDATHGGIEAEQRLVRELEAQAAPDAAIVTVQPWRALAGWQPTLRHPERALGLHFPAPVGRSPLVEVMIGPASDAAALRKSLGLVGILGKTAVVVQEAAGGLVQRVLVAGFAEALRLLHDDGIAPDRIEHAMRQFGMAYGPLEHLDAWGLDEFVLCARRLEPALLEAPADQPIIEHMVEKRWLGTKTGIGFYRYRHGRKTPNRSLARWLARTFAGQVTARSAADQRRHIEQRLVGRTVNEAFRCLDEQVVRTAEELDLAMSLVGWAPHRGGPCRYAEQYGYAETVQLLHELTQSLGQRFAPCPALLRLSDQ